MSFKYLKKKDFLFLSNNEMNEQKQNYAFIQYKKNSHKKLYLKG
jgi:hypothetical protein